MSSRRKWVAGATFSTWRISTAGGQWSCNCAAGKTLRGELVRLELLLVIRLARDEGNLIKWSGLDEEEAGPDEKSFLTGSRHGRPSSP